VFTASAAASIRARSRAGRSVLGRAELAELGCTESQLRARLAAGRWRTLGSAVVLHNGPLARRERWQAALLNCGPRSVLGSFTAAEAAGLRGWERDDVHVLAPAGVARPSIDEFDVVLHRTADLARQDPMRTRRIQRTEHALVLAASSFARPRPAVGIVAAGVQQRLTTARHLAEALGLASRTRHRSALTAAVDDIAGGAQALSEIDFARLCRRHRLPVPVRQSVRRGPGGRRRYLDAEWLRQDGRRVVVEVDGAVHLVPTRWFEDQIRHNEIVLANSLVLRFPSVVVRTEPALVVDQLRRALLIARS